MTAHEYRVVASETGEVLEGRPSPALVTQTSRKVFPRLWALAYLDGAGIWQYVPDSQATAPRFRGLMLVAVYVTGAG